MLNDLLFFFKSGQRCSSLSWCRPVWRSRRSAATSTWPSSNTAMTCVRTSSSCRSFRWWIGCYDARTWTSSWLRIACWPLPLVTVTPFFSLLLTERSLNWFMVVVQVSSSTSRACRYAKWATRRAASSTSSADTIRATADPTASPRKSWTVTSVAAVLTQTFPAFYASVDDFSKFFQIVNV